jgi:hypothetical protein
MNESRAIKREQIAGGIEVAARYLLMGAARYYFYCLASYRLYRLP